MHLFLDTEFTDANLLKAELISLALVSEDGARELYLERNPLPERYSVFVRHHVIPLLDRGPSAVPDHEFTRRLRAFMRASKEPIVFCDYPGDKFLMQVGLAGFTLLHSALADCGPIPAIRWNIVDEPELVARIERWFAAHGEARRHHALIDARAFRDCWLVHRSR